MLSTATQIFQGIALLLIGGFVAHLWKKHRARLRQLVWSVQYLRVAAAGEDPSFGRVDVLWNYIPMTNLYAALLKVENESTSDLQDITLNIVSLEGSRILMAVGSLEGSIQSIPFTEDFSNALRAQDPADLQYLETHRDFRIPVLNRGAKANFSFLLNRDDAEQPRITVACNHLGVQFKYKAAGITTWGVPQWHAIIVGMVVSLGVVALLASVMALPQTAALGAWLLGILATLIGVGVIKLWRLILRLFA